MLGCKYKNTAQYQLKYSELIDTCWDVNNHETVPCWQGTGINRYMLGCKSLNAATTGFLSIELIDTCWDVNFVMLSERCTFITY